jgi:MFS family permease
MEDSSKKNPFLGWRMVGIALFADFCVVGFAFQSYPVIQLILAEEMELSRFLATLTIPGFMLISAITMPVVGKLLDTYSIRSVLILGSFVYGLSLISLYFVNSYTAFIVIFVLPIALGASLMGNLSVSKLVSRWFREYTGRALGIAALGVSFSGLVMPNLTNYLLIDLGLSWREAYLYYGLFTLIINAPLFRYLVIDNPEDVNQLPDGKTLSDEQDLIEDVGEDWTLKQLMNDRNFWVLSFVFALQFCAMMAVLAHITFYASERGWAEQAAWIFSMYAVPAMISKLVFGWLIENKMDARLAVSTSLVIQLVGTLLILGSDSPNQLSFIIALFGFGGGAALPLSNILFNKVYTQKSFGFSRGTAQPFISIFQVSGTPVVALMFDAYGNYQSAFLFLCSLLVLATIVIWFLKMPETNKEN